MGLLETLDDAANSVQGLANKIDPNSSQVISDYQSDGFIVAETPAANGLGLPSSKVPNNRNGKTKRHLIHWFVPEFGVVKMYVNPNSIHYNFSKIINSTQTKGGFVTQYWGEALTELRIAGTTGSSGVEGINVLYEVYRSEQLSFDALGLSLAANQQVAGFENVFDSITDTLFGTGDSPLAQIGDAVSEFTSGMMSTDPAVQNALPKNIPSLASMALGVEMFYNGWVFRGYFKSFDFTESATNLGMFDYNMSFTVTQRRGYRTNFLPWHRSAVDGPSDISENGNPHSFARRK